MKRRTYPLYAVIFAASVATSLLLGGNVIDGTATTANLAEGYTGPEVTTAAPREANLLTPGTSVSVGVGKNAVTCTAGWFARNARDPKSQGTLLLAGHCARQGPGAPVSMNYRGKTVEIGRIVDTTFSEPYNHSMPDLAVATIEKTSENSTVKFRPFNVPKLPLRSTTPSAEEVDASRKGSEVCWMSEVRDSNLGDYEEGSYEETCGVLAAAGGGKILVRIDENAYSPVQAGAPAYIGNVTVNGERYEEPLGIVTDLYDGYAVIDTLDVFLAKSEMKIITR